MLRARKWNEPETERLVDGDPVSYAPDEYVDLFEMNAGDVVFVEIESGTLGGPASRNGWSLWRVEVVDVSEHRRTNTTIPVTYEAAEQELHERELRQEAPTRPSLSQPPPFPRRVPLPFDPDTGDTDRPPPMPPDDEKPT